MRAGGGRAGRGGAGDLLPDERGTAAIEYALVASVVAVLAIGGLRAVGGATGGLYAILERVSLALRGMFAG